MDDRIDWTPWATRLLAGWRLIALTAVLAAVIALLSILRDPLRYRASALLAVARPEAALEFDPRFAAPAPNPAFPYRVGSLRTYPELLTSAGMASAVLAAYPESDVPAERPADLLDMVEIRSVAEGSLLRITTRATGLDEAVELAEVWAEVALAEAGDLYGSGAGLVSVETARDDAAADLSEREAALVRFYEESELAALEVALEAEQAIQTGRLAGAERLAQAARDARSMAERLEAGGSLGAAEQMAASRIAIDLLSAQPADGLSLELVSLPAGSGNPNPEALLVLADEAERRADQEAETAEAASQRIQSLNLAVMEQGQRLEALERERLLAEERYLTLARKADELSVTNVATRPELRRAGPAVAEPGLPWADYAARLLSALALGLIAGLALVLLRPDAGAA